MSQSILPLVLGGAAAISIGLYFGGSGHPASSAPKHNQLTRRNSDLAFSSEGAAIRRAGKAEGHSGKGTTQRTTTMREPNLYKHATSLDEATREVTFWFT
mmetsp:Transcript_9750/g.25213  ORF Transcript_9750/g.25213 Transcript_9750/m.25213 type:complete len:100 (+) Transcript_9750:99-398(+)|eukprot:CAMPEP_0119411162 /NCGR_PEP_ID=MMETSP1335-20130426/3971_1 /TAXON_ID=259385 /ORGANISM="Chrysoculter rhomboideus, Strain RCC1486" /LENGTH=99 /DNA_ID=CAMNT_0007435771 /DNA_START=101 /DNA_END=400 /DNA_ORIENTATION=-